MYFEPTPFCQVWIFFQISYTKLQLGWINLTNKSSSLTQFIHSHEMSWNGIHNKLRFRDHKKQEAGRCTVFGEHSSNWIRCFFLCLCWCRSREHWNAQCYVSIPVADADRSQINCVSGHQVEKLKIGIWYQKWFWLIESK